MCPAAVDGHGTRGLTGDRHSRRRRRAGRPRATREPHPGHEHQEGSRQQPHRQGARGARGGAARQRQCRLWRDGHLPQRGPGANGQGAHAGPGAAVDDVRQRNPEAAGVPVTPMRTRAMKRQTWLVQALVALIILAGGGLAEAGVIFPVDQTTGVPILNTTVTISLFDASGNDITDTWLPTWEPNRISSVNVGFSVQGAPVITGATATLKGDVLLPATLNGQSYLATIPQDSNLNGIPDIWERQFCPNNTCPVGNEDNDTGPVVGTPTGDGIAAFDEFRGFIVSNVHVSTDPRQRDLFVHLVNAQCGAAANSLLGGGATTYPTDGSSVCTNLASLVPGAQVHLLGYPPTPANPMTPEWVDRFSSFSQQTGFVYSDGTSIPPADDRRINANAIFPLGVPNLTAGPIQKGLRVTECLDVSAPQPLGTTGIGSTNGPDNSLVYTQRIVSYINGMITAGGTRTLKLFVFQNGAWVATFSGTGARTDADRNVILSQAVKCYVD